MAAHSASTATEVRCSTASLDGGGAGSPATASTRKSASSCNTPVGRAAPPGQSGDLGDAPEPGPGPEDVVLAAAQLLAVVVQRRRLARQGHGDHGNPARLQALGGGDGAAALVTGELAGIAAGQPDHGAILQGLHARGECERPVGPAGGLAGEQPGQLLGVEREQARIVTGRQQHPGGVGIAHQPHGPAGVRFGEQRHQHHGPPDPVGLDVAAAHRRRAVDHEQHRGAHLVGRVAGPRQARIGQGEGGEQPEQHQEQPAEPCPPAPPLAGGGEGPRLQ
ncbi:hypothetical protein [Guyparkeria sp. SB14A]|uniref:hypothetical protein n=1 Tax=Guyparkeria sp. SB14A TaxID=2571147 RepID=UPI001FFD5492|nr:hypothetical protein [Guyparkeria sp. SB14A]